MLLYVKSDLIV